MHVSAHLFGMAAAGFFMTSIFGLINLKTKISLHAGGVGMLVGYIVAYSLNQSFLLVWPMILAILVAGLVIMARLYLNKHTPKQVYLGFGLGSLITFISDLVFVYLGF
jgi:membrane-associated phospholipid phosphatase